MKTSQKKVLGLIAFFSLCIPGFAQVSTDKDNAFDFTAAKTYAWLRPDIKTGSNPLYNSSLIIQNIENQVDEELSRRGMTRVNDKPDLEVVFHTYTEKRQESYSVPGPGFYYPYGFYRGWGYYGWNTGFRSRTYTEGTLIIDFIDARSRMLVWRGSAEAALVGYNQLESQVHLGVRKIMKRYPVKPLK
jgi:hypothetical protein